MIVLIVLYYYLVSGLSQCQWRQPISRIHNNWYDYTITVSKLGEYFPGPTYKLLLIFTVISDVYRSFTTFTRYCLIQWISKLWNPLRKTVPSKFHRPRGHSKRNCLHDWTNFHRSRAWQIVLIFNTAMTKRNFVHILWVIQQNKSIILILKRG